MQEGALLCIQRLKRANISIWMLSGDRVETCVNIAMACSLIHPNMYFARVTTADLPAAGLAGAEGIWGATQKDSVLEKLKTAVVKCKTPKYASLDRALIIDGTAIEIGLEVGVRAGGRSGRGAGGWSNAPRSRRDYSEGVRGF